MSGHSKWASIKHSKGKADKQRSKVFSKLSKEISVAAKLGDKDPAMNPRLRSAIQAAKSANMPKDNIERAIAKSSANSETNYENLRYEGFGPDKIAVIVEVLTDNKNRTVADIRHLITKYGGNLGENGSVAWMFDKKGQIILKRDDQDENILFEDAIDAGAEDFEAVHDAFIITTDPADILSVRSSIENKGYFVESSKVEMLPKNLHKINDENSEKAISLLNEIEDHDDIKSIYTNFEPAD